MYLPTGTSFKKAIFKSATSVHYTPIAEMLIFSPMEQSCLFVPIFFDNNVQPSSLFCFTHRPHWKDSLAGPLDFWEDALRANPISLG